MRPIDTAFIDTLIDASAKVLTHYYRNFGDITSKADKSPVTIADQETEKALRALITEHFPEDGIQGEEYGIERADSPYSWFLDPIDGTTSFMIGRPTFGTLIALTHDGQSIAGVINQPITNECWLGIKGQGATLNGTPIRTRQCKSLADAVICTTGPNYFNDQTLSIFNRIANTARFQLYGGDCYSYGLLASGHVDIVMESGLKAHDFMAFIPLIEEAGGVITDWEGNALTFESKGDIIVSATPELHQEVLGLI
jgi:histidinol phosphatase-like enzyme (inositol monophosphatase family)